MSESARKHKAGAPARLKFGIFTCSTSRYLQSKKGEEFEDTSGDLIEKLLRNAGHQVALRKLIPDDRAMIKQGVKRALASPDLDAAVFCGGTGIAPTDITIETISPLLEKVLPGFGEIFRRLSFDEIGSAAVLSRAVAGVAKGKALFCIPGSPDAVRVCMEKLILPETPHVVKHARE
jgi:molybdenum cofactor biosynthesis protein B